MNYSEETADEMTELQDRIETLGLWELDSKVDQAMEALGCPSDEQPVATLSGGERRRIALCRLLLWEPELLLLDEPSLGLAPLVVKGIFDAIRRLNREDGMTIFLVEQNAYHALKLAHRGYVLVNGRITMSGTGRQLLDDPSVKAAYLEGGHAAPAAGDAHA